MTDNRFRIYYETLGGHVHMRVFVGHHTSSSYGLAGTLTMRIDEFADFQEACNPQITFQTDRRHPQ